MIVSEKGDKRCPYLPLPEEDIKMIDFRDQVLAAPKDIEDLAEVGRMAETCPYFGSRRAIPQAEVRDMLLSDYPSLMSELAGHTSVQPVATEVCARSFRDRPQGSDSRDR